MMTRGARELLAWKDRFGLNQTELAERIGVSVPYVSQLLDGKRSPSLHLVAKIYELAGITLQAWLDSTPSTSDYKVDRRRRKLSVSNQLTTIGQS